MKKNKKRYSVFLLLFIFSILSTNISAAPLSTPAASYCTRSSENVLAVNLAGSEDAWVDGFNYTRLSSNPNVAIEFKGPIFESAPAGQVNAFSQIEAENCIDNNGITIEDCSDSGGGKNLAYIGNGDFTGYNYIYFPRGVKGFQARVSSDTEGGYIELRLDQPGGEIIGKCHITRTGGWQTYSEVTCELTRSVQGSHKLYLFYTGERDNGICNVNWFRFTKSAFEPIRVKASDEATGNYSMYRLVDFGVKDGPVRFKAHMSSQTAASVDIRLDNSSGTLIGTLNTQNLSVNSTDVECSINQKVTGVHTLYLVDSTNSGILSSIGWFVFDATEESMPSMDGNLSKLLTQGVKGYTLELRASLEKNNVYEVYLYTTDVGKENKQVFDLFMNGSKVDTIDSERSGLRWEKKGPYLAKVLNDGTLSIQCVSKRGTASIAGIQFSKVSYSKQFKDVKMKDWYYIPVMELASKGIISGKGNNEFKPNEHIIGEHVSYMMFNVMKQSIAEKDSTFNPDEVKSFSDVSPDFWAYQYMKAYYNYFSREKMLKYDVNTKIAFKAKEYTASQKVRREEFAMAMVGAKRLDYNSDGKIFVLDPDREPGSKLNLYRNKDYGKITDSFRYFIELALEKGMMKGDTKGNLNPKDPVTRGEAAAFIYSALKLNENNFVKPSTDKVIPVPRITAKKRYVKVGILVLPAPAENGAVNDANPDFSLMELLDRNINKPMDWILMNPFPPQFNKNDFKDVFNYNSTKVSGINNQSFTDFSRYFKDLRSVARAQTDLEADMTNSGAVGNAENIKKSRFYKYWEVALDDPNLTPEKIAKNYDILFQTSHGKITYTPAVQQKMKAFLNAGGQLWWENCRGLEIKTGEGFTDDVKFVSINPGNNYKYPQVPVLDNEGNLHPLLDNIYTIDQNKTTRVNAPGLFNKNTEISMLGDGEEWLNDDNRYISGELPTDITVLNIEEPSTGMKHPNIIVRNVKNQTDTAGRIIMTTTDIGCGITKHVVRSGGKAVEDYKFCYNLFGWMSRIGVSFDETNDEVFNTKKDFNARVTLTNNGAKTQTYDLSPQYNTNIWDLQTTHEYDNYKKNKPWILSLDAKGYPKKIKMGPNQSENITFKLKIKALQYLRYDFTLKANESGVTASRDNDEDTYTLFRGKIKNPEFLINSKAVHQNDEECFEVDIPAPNQSQIDGNPVNYTVTLKLKENNEIIDPQGILNRIEIDGATNKSLYESYNDSVVIDNTGTPVIQVSFKNIKFTAQNQKIKLNIHLEKLIQNSHYAVTGRIETYDPNAGQRLAYSDEVGFNIK